MSDAVPNLYRIGVYGTLKKGFGRNSLLYGTSNVGIAYIPGLMLHLGPFPMVIPQNPEFPLMKFSQIACEVYDVTKDILDKLDSIEGHPDFYKRTEVDSPVHGRIWVYMGNPEVYGKGIQKYVPDGVWLGENTTKALKVDFKDGKQKPHIIYVGRDGKEKVMEVDGKKNTASKIDVNSIGSTAGTVLALPDKTSMQKFSYETFLIPADETKLALVPKVKTLE